MNLLEKLDEIKITKECPFCHGQLKYNNSHQGIAMLKCTSCYAAPFGCRICNVIIPVTDIFPENGCSPCPTCNRNAVPDLAGNGYFILQS